jgi:hypothetical protein
VLFAVLTTFGAFVRRLLLLPETSAIAVGEF